MEPRYEIFDHTADMGMRVVAPTMSALLAPAKDGLYSMIGELATAGAEQTLELNLIGDDPSIMLRDFLDELLVLFDRDKRIAVALDDAALTADCLHVAAQTAKLAAPLADTPLGRSLGGSGDAIRRGRRAEGNPLH